VPVALSRTQARLAARACRSLAAIMRKDADNQRNPSISGPKLAQAEQLEKLAALFEAHAGVASK
jgi:hypothetical protein